MPYQSETPQGELAKEVAASVAMTNEADRNGWGSKPCPPEELPTQPQYELGRKTVVMDWLQWGNEWNDRMAELTLEHLAALTAEVERLRYALKHYSSDSMRVGSTISPRHADEALRGAKE